MAQVENKADSEELEEDDSDEAPEDAESLDVDHLMKSMDRLKRRGARADDPAWRRLERYREDRYTRELLSDFDDYDLEGEVIMSEDLNGGLQTAEETESASTPSRARKKRKH